MKMKLEGGAMVDLLSGEEFHQGIELLGGRITDASKAMERLPAADGITQTIPATVTTDGSGNLGGGVNPTNPPALWRVPQGFSARLFRGTVDTTAATPAAPITAGWMRLYRDQVLPSSLIMFLPVGGVVAPLVWTDGRHNAAYLTDGQQLVVVGAGLPVNTTFGFSFTVTLYDGSRDHR